MQMKQSYLQLFSSRVQKEKSNNVIKKVGAERIMRNQIMPHEVVDEVTSVQTVSPHGSHGSTYGHGHGQGHGHGHGHGRSYDSAAGWNE